MDTLRAMVDDVAGSERFDIKDQVASIREVFEGRPAGDGASASGKKAEKPRRKPGTLEISEEDMNSLRTRGKYLYTVKIFLNEDLRVKGRTPYDYINEMERLGQFVDSFLDDTSVGGLDDCLNNDLAFKFIFASVLEPDLIPVALELPDDRISVFNFEEMQKANLRILEEPAPSKTPDTVAPTVMSQAAETRRLRRRVPRKPNRSMTRWRRPREPAPFKPRINCGSG